MPKLSFNSDYEDLLTIYGKKSHFNQYYHLDTPFSFVLETYTCNDNSEYINIVNFTPNNIKHMLMNDAAHLAAAKGRTLHQHDYYELMFVLDGTVINDIENTQRIYPKGSCCIVNCNLRHAEKFEGNFRVFFLNLSKEYIGKMLSNISNLYFDEEKNIVNSDVFQFLLNNETAESANDKAFLDLFPLLQNSHIYKLIYKSGENIAKAILSPDFGSSHLVDGYISTILALLCDTSAFYATSIALNHGNDFLIFARASHLIEASYGLLSRQELSLRLNYSGDYINRIVKKYTGMNLSNYCMTFRLTRALVLLKDKALSISEISYQLGFKNRTHFYKHFKEKYGAMPSAFR